MTVLRANSLAAVTIFVWSTKLNVSSWVSFRTAWRASTTSCSTLSGRASLLRTAIRDLLPRVVRRFAQRRPQPLHAALDVQGGLHALEGQSQLDQRDGHRRAHADEH